MISPLRTRASPAPSNHPYRLEGRPANGGAEALTAQGAVRAQA